jgi:CheY-like chemotaxis protein
MNPTAQTVLIVDDDKDIRAILAAYSIDLGLVPEQAENGASALAHARRAAPDLILLDVEMPVMNGADTLVWLRQDRDLRDIPVIMISGVNDEAIALRCIEHGAEDFIDKPIDFTLLRVRMKSSLERARLRRMERKYQH